MDVSNITHSTIAMTRSRDDFPLYNVILCIGSNSNPNENIVKAMKIINEEFDLQNISPVYETTSIDKQGKIDADKPRYYNLACSIYTILDFNRLKGNLKDIENRLGRVRDPSNKFASITIDLDIFYHGRLDQTGNQGEFISSSDLKFFHVIIPVADVQPDLKCDKSDTRMVDFAKEQTGLAEPNLFFPIVKDGTNEVLKKIFESRILKPLNVNRKDSI